MPLFEYMEQTQRFLRDGNQGLIDPGDLISYINRARREVAQRAQCVRILPPISGAITSATIVSPGSGYTNPTVVISAPDTPDGSPAYPNGAQATGVATLDMGQILNVDITFGGAGYFEPLITISDPTGTGAAVSPNLSWLNQTYNGQEVYRFSDINLQNFPGVKSIVAVKSVGIIFSNYRYALPCYSFSMYQAAIRQYPRQYTYVPTICAQYGQGNNGSLYMYPLPSQSYQMEWDCFCLPNDLMTDLDFEAIPQPWQDPVPYLAAHFAYLELQNLNYAKGYRDMFDQQMHQASGYARPGRATNLIGRY